MLPHHTRILSQVPRLYYRYLASVADTVAPAPYQIFDRYAKVLQKDRSAAPSRVETSRTVDYVRDEVAHRMVERMLVSIGPRSFFTYLNASRAGYQTQLQNRARSGVWPRPLFQVAGD